MMLCKLLSLSIAVILMTTEEPIKHFEASSSPSIIIAIKGSTAQINWNSTYIADGTHNEGQAEVKITNIGQQIIVNSTSQTEAKLLASKLGPSSPLSLASPVPAPFNGRVDVISSNNTLVLHNLQYNDSIYELSSFISMWVDFGNAKAITTCLLKPVVSIKVIGRPDFRAKPPITLDVKEGSSLELPVEMDGNPQPSADFTWPHLTGSSPTNVPSEQLYPFVYSSTYTLNNINASYCGRILQTTLKNSAGSSDTASTIVYVLLKLDMDLRLKAGKVRGTRCVELKWNKVESGACYVKYEAVLKNALGNVEYSNSGYNIGEMTMCRDAPYSNVTDVELTVSFKSTSKKFTAKVSDTSVDEPTNPPVGQNTTASVPTPASGTSENAPTGPTTEPKDSGSNVGVIIAGVIIGVVGLVVLVIIIVVFYIKRYKRKRGDPEQDREGDQSQKVYCEVDKGDPEQSKLIFGTGTELKLLPQSPCQDQDVGS